MTHWSIWALKPLFVSNTLAFEHRPTKFILEFEVISIRIFSYSLHSSHHFLLTYHPTWSRNSKCLAIIHLWSVGQNSENWDCPENVSVGVLTILILYHVSQAEAFALPSLHEYLLPWLWKFWAPKSQDTLSFNNSQGNSSVYRPTKTNNHHILNPCLLFYMIHRACIFKHFPVTLRTTNLKLQKPKASQNHLIPGDGTLSRPKPLPTVLRCVCYVSQHNQNFMCLSPLSEKADLGWTKSPLTADHHKANMTKQNPS